MVKIKITFKGKKMTLKGIGFGRYQMATLGHHGLLATRRRVAKGLGASDQVMPPLSAGYAKRKKHSKKRDLWFTGAMIRNISVRSASSDRAIIALTSRKARMKARANQRISPWWGWSPSVIRQVIAKARSLFKVEVHERVRPIFRNGGRYRPGGRGFFVRDGRFRRAA